MSSPERGVTVSAATDNMQATAIPNGVASLKAGLSPVQHLRCVFFLSLWQPPFLRMT